MDSHLVCDLESVAQALAGDVSAARFLGAVKNLLHVQSCLSDLKQAADSLAALEALLASPRKRGTKERAATETALLSTAANLYARAVASAGGGREGGRGSTNIRDRLPVSSRSDHDLIVRVRNRALAHVYHEEALGGEIWHRSRAFLVEFSEGWRTAAFTQKLGFDGTLFRRLLSLVPVGISILQGQSIDAQAVISDELSLRPDLIALLRGHLVDPVAAFGSFETYRAALATVEEGSGGGVLRGGLSPR